MPFHRVTERGNDLGLWAKVKKLSKCAVRELAQTSPKDCGKIKVRVVRSLSLKLIC